VGISVVSYINYTLNKNLLYKNVDEKLKSVALNTPLFLDENTQDKAFKNNITPNEDMKNILALSKLTDNSKVAYVYTMVKKGDDVYFTSSSATKDELKKDEATKYLDKYDEATQLLKDAFETHKIAYEESTDKWGTFRTVFIPMKTKDGRWYIVGADIKITDILSELNNYIKNIFLVQIILLIIILILSFYFHKISKLEFNEIKKIENKLKNKIKEKTRKLEELNLSLEDRVKEEVEKNREKDKAIQQQQKLAQMGEMLSMIAHQWRQPLSAINSTAGALKLKAKFNKLDTQTAMELSSDIMEFSQHLSSTIDDFRKFFKSDKKLEKTTFKEIVDSVFNIIESSLIKKKINLIQNINSEVSFLTYPNELKQVVLNLIKNAEDVLIQNNIQNPTITIEANKNILTISDNGGGIPEDIIDKIFDPYFSTKTQKDGTGLGLYMSKAVN